VKIELNFVDFYEITWDIMG